MANTLLARIHSQASFIIEFGWRCGRRQWVVENKITRMQNTGE
jgi:hypothetical protein